MELCHSKTGVPYYQFGAFREFDFLRHGVFTRQGGVSPPPFDSLNVGRAVGDPAMHVAENRGIISQVMGGTGMVFLHQVHGSDVFVVEGTADETAADPVKADAMITDVPGHCLIIQVADCQAVLMVDPERRVVANVHAGWRGSIQNILGKTVQAMAARFGCRPGDIHAGIGPSLGPCCAEFVNYPTEIPERLWQYRRKGMMFDFWAVSRDQLMGAGLLRESISIGGMCTRCRQDLFFSYRRQKKTGRFAAVIGLT